METSVLSTMGFSMNFDILKYCITKWLILVTAFGHPSIVAPEILWVELCPPKTDSCIKVLIPRTPDCDFI